MPLQGVITYKRDNIIEVTLIEKLIGHIKQKVWILRKERTLRGLRVIFFPKTRYWVYQMSSNDSLVNEIPL